MDHHAMQIHRFYRLPPEDPHQTDPICPSDAATLNHSTAVIYTHQLKMVTNVDSFSRTLTISELQSITCHMGLHSRWRGVAVMLHLINEVALRWAWLVLGWVTRYEASQLGRLCLLPSISALWLSSNKWQRLA